MEEKFPQLQTYKDYDGSIDTAYIRLNDGKSHHCKMSAVDDDVILDYDSGDVMIGIEIICPIYDEMREEIRKQLTLQNVSIEDIDEIMRELLDE